MFNTLFQMEELTHNEFLSIIRSNPIEDDFISAMCALMDFFQYEQNLKPSNNNSFIQDCFKKIFPEYNELPTGHRLLELKKLLEDGSPK